MARLSRFVAVAVLLGGATVFLSACTGGTDPVASPSPSVSTAVTASPSASPSPTPLTDEELLALIPESARAENFGGAVNFARFFLVESNRMFVDHGPEAFRFSSEPDCEFCASVLASHDEHVATGSTVVGGDIEVASELAKGGLQNDGTWLVQFPMTVHEAKYFNLDGSLRSSVDAANFDVGVSLGYENEHWLVLGLNFEESV